MGREALQLCAVRVRRLNFEKRRLAQRPSDVVVPEALGERCAVEISAFSWRLLRWMGQLDGRLLGARQLSVVDVFQKQEAWSLRELEKLYE